MTRSNLQQLFNHDYFVCEKSDGLRCLLYTVGVEGNENVFLITRNDEYFRIPYMHFPTQENAVDFHSEGTLIDGELIYGYQSDGSMELQYLIFDCLAINGRSIISRPLDRRLGYAMESLFRPHEKLRTLYPEDCSMFPFKVLFKEMKFSYDVKKVFDAIPKLKHISDGLIFTCCETPYVIGSDETLMKWKPAEENTIDFRLILKFPVFIDEELNPNDEDYSYVDYDTKPKFHLYSWEGKNNDKYFDELFVTDEEWEELKNLQEPLDARVVECYKDKENRWRYLRFRDDKLNGNHSSVVEKVLTSIRDCVSKQELLDSAEGIRNRSIQRKQERRNNPRSSVPHNGTARHSVSSSVDTSQQSQSQRKTQPQPANTRSSISQNGSLHEIADALPSQSPVAGTSASVNDKRSGEYSTDEVSKRRRGE